MDELREAARTTGVTPAARTAHCWQVEVLREIRPGDVGLVACPAAPPAAGPPAAGPPADRPGDPGTGAPPGSRTPTLDFGRPGRGPALDGPPPSLYIRSQPQPPEPKRPGSRPHPPQPQRRPADLPGPSPAAETGIEVTHTARDSPPAPPAPHTAPWPGSGTGREARTALDGAGPEAAHTGRRVHGDPALRRMGRGIRRVVGASTSQDVHDRIEVVARLRQPVTTTRRIAVTSVRGGAGKTTIASLTASALSRHRHDRVLLIDADPGFGTMPLRVGVSAAPSLRGFAGRDLRSFDDARGLLARTDTGLWILPGAGMGTTAGDAETAPAGQDDGELLRTVVAALGRFFAVIIIDCGAGLTGEPQRGLLAEAHAHIHVAPATPEGVVSAGRALDWLAANGLGDLLPRTVAVFAVHAPHSRPDLTSAAEVLRSEGIGVTQIAYDRHLAAGGTLDPSLLAEGTRLAAIEIAGDALARARMPPGHGPGG